MWVEALKLIVHDIEEEVRRTYVYDIEEVRSEVKLTEVEMLVLLARRKRSYSVGVKMK